MPHLHRRAENWVISNPIEEEIARGTIDGMVEFTGFGERNNLQVFAQGVDFWGGSSSQPPWPNQSYGEQMMVISSNYDDRLNGTGIQKVEIDYLDAIGNEQYETLNMNGTAFVRTVGTNIRFVNALHASQVGSGTVSSGDVSICTNGTISTVYNMIASNENMSLSTQQMIPYGKTFYLHEWTASCIDPTTNKTTITKIRLRATTAHGTRFEGVFLFSDTANLANSSYNKHFNIPKKISQLSVIKVTAWAIAAGAYAAASYSGHIEDNE